MIRLNAAHRKPALSARFCSSWVKEEGVELNSINASHPLQYLGYRARRVRPCPGDAAALGYLIEFLRREGVIPAEKVPARRLTPAEHCAQAYEQHLREARALASATIVNYLPYVRRFLENRFGDRQVTLSRLRACDVVRFVQRQAPRLPLGGAKVMTTALRSFLRYARYCGEIALDLDAAVPVVAHWSMTSIPRAIAANQVSQLLACVDRRTPAPADAYFCVPRLRSAALEVPVALDRSFVIGSNVPE